MSSVTSSALPFYAGQPQQYPTPLARFLPQLDYGAVSAWLAAHVEPGGVVIDPFGASPHLAEEAARAGYRVIVAANNPIARFLIELTAQPPSADDLKSALAELAATRRGDERLEPHLLNLYATTCEACGGAVSAERFLWEDGADAPYAKELSCPHCGEAGEYATTEADKQLARQYSGGGPNRARALERVAPIDSPDRAYAEEALNAYPPRAVYALFTMINKFSGLTLNEQQGDHLAALLLAACDRASALWSVRDKRRRPLQLSTPPRYYEHNIWLALETAIPLWATGAGPVAMSTWPELPPENGGICIYEGRLRDLAEQLDAVPLAGVLSALPRPNQAFWTLSALWAGWLWGREAIGPFTSVLRRQRYDWSWHTTALHATLSRLAPQLVEGTPFFGMITESEAGFDAAAILAAELADLRLVSIAARPGQQQTQILWRKQRQPVGEETPPSFSESARLLLERRGEPAAYLLMQDAALSGWAHSLAQPEEGTTPADLFNQARDELSNAFRYQTGFLRYGGSEKDATSGRWWLRDDKQAAEAISDRVEKFIVGQLLDTPGQPFEAIQRDLLAAFPGLQTPPSAMLTQVLASYADVADDGWQLRASEAPKRRREDLDAIKSTLTELGERMGFAVESGETVRWTSGERSMQFVVIASAVFGSTLRNTIKATHNFVVLPGSRAQLALHKLAANPHLAQLAEGWDYLKFRLVRRMAENREITPELFLQQVAIDPLSDDSTQLPLL